METTQTTTISAGQLPATEKQLNLMAALGVEAKNGLTVAEASQMISAAQAARANLDPTPAQKAKLDYLHGRPLPGGSRREYSTSIAMMVALTKFRIDGDAAALAAAISERFERAVRVDAPAVEAAEPAVF